MNIELTPHQQNFHDIIIDWINEFKNLSYKDNHYIVCAGYAGTGKTTILGEVLNSLNKMGLRVACGTYTGKAAQVLRTKIFGYNKEYAGTIHGMIYRPKIDKNGKLLGFVCRSKLACDIIIIDESSMINKEIFNDLIKYKIPIIFIGDDAQLPPVGGEKFDIFTNTEVKLTEIHRQAENSPIIKMSMIVRNGGKLKIEIFGKNCARMDWEDDRAKKTLFQYDLLKDNIILCGMNRTRVVLNQLIRENLGFKKDIPQKKEKVVCLQNNHNLGIMNGCLGFIEAIELFKDYAYIGKIRFNYDRLSTDHFIFKDGFNQVNQSEYFDFLQVSKAKIKKDKKNYDKLDLMDYGYALSVHKSQGSTFENVILVNERTYYQDDNDYQRWLYTGITRASKKLLIIDNF